MLDASQIEAGGLVIDLQPVPLDHVLTRLVREFREQHPERTVRLSAVARSAVVIADPFRVEQVVLNLLSNADKYTPTDLPISVSAVPTGDHVTISVRDRGEGSRRASRPDLRPVLPRDGGGRSASPRIRPGAVHRTHARGGDVGTDLGVRRRRRDDVLVQPPGRRPRDRRGGRRAGASAVEDSPQVLVRG